MSGQIGEQLSAFGDEGDTLLDPGRRVQPLDALAVEEYVAVPG